MSVFIIHNRYGKNRRERVVLFLKIWNLLKTIRKSNANKSIVLSLKFVFLFKRRLLFRRVDDNNGIAKSILLLFLFQFEKHNFKTPLAIFTFNKKILFFSSPQLISNGNPLRIVFPKFKYEIITIILRVICIGGQNKVIFFLILIHYSNIFICESFKR